jgi:hypothetical protein
MSKRGLCSICTDPKRNAFVTEHLRLGRTANAIEALSRAPAASDMGLSPIRYETVLKHVRHGFEERPVAPEEPAVPAVYERTPANVKPVTTDVATLVAQKATEGLQDGSLRVTTAHGLQAQRMLDAREDRRQDRQLAIALAKMLSGQSAVPGHLIVRNVTPPSTSEDDFAPGLAMGRDE